MDFIEFKYTTREGAEVTFTDNEYIGINQDELDIYLYFQDNKLLPIEFRVRWEDAWDLGSVIQYYGEPSFYTIDYDQHGYYPHIYYSQLGLIFIAYQDHKPLNERMPVDTIYITDLPANQEKYLALRNRMYEDHFTGSEQPVTQYDWEGFGICPQEIYYD